MCSGNIGSSLREWWEGRHAAAGGSSDSHAADARRAGRTVARCGPSRGAGFATGLRGGGSADFSACRTVRRCTRWRRASSRIGEPLSRLALRICSNSPTFDNSPSFAAGKSDSTERRHWIGRRWCPHVLCQGPAPLIRDGRGGVRQPPTHDEEPPRCGTGSRERSMVRMTSQRRRARQMTAAVCFFPSARLRS